MQISEEKMSERLTEDQIEQNKKEMLVLVKGIKRKGIEGLCNWMSSSDFFYAPASTRHHGNFRGGLSAHSYEIYKEFDRQVDNYGLVVPKDSRILASFLHDACKIDLYTENTLKGGKISEAKPYKIEDNFPFGHGERSAIVVQKHIILTEQEAMLIRWHMGQYDKSFEDYKEVIEKKFPECILFHHIDYEVSLFRGL
jgi:hypothetical protein